MRDALWENGHGAWCVVRRAWRTEGGERRAERWWRRVEGLGGAALEARGAACGRSSPCTLCCAVRSRTWAAKLFELLRALEHCVADVLVGVRYGEAVRQDEAAHAGTRDQHLQRRILADCVGRLSHCCSCGWRVGGRDAARSGAAHCRAHRARRWPQRGRKAHRAAERREDGGCQQTGRRSHRAPTRCGRTNEF